MKLHSALRCVLLAALATPTLAGETGLGGTPSWTRVGPGADFYQVSTTTRGPLLGLSAFDPLILHVPPPPAGAQVVQAFLLWSFESDGVPPATDVLAINGRPVVGELVGLGAPGPDWTKRRGAVYLDCGAAGHLIIGGDNALQGVVDKPHAGDRRTVGTGLTVVVVTTTPGAPERRVSLWTGFTATSSSESGHAQARLAFLRPFAGGDAHLFLNAHNGLPLGQDELFVSQRSAGGLLQGTSGPLDTWTGNAGPLPFANRYDALDDDVAGFLSQGTAHLDLRTSNEGFPIPNEIAHSLVVLSTQER